MNAEPPLARSFHPSAFTLHPWIQGRWIVRIGGEGSSLGSFVRFGHDVNRGKLASTDVNWWSIDARDPEFPTPTASNDTSAYAAKVPAETIISKAVIVGNPRKR